MSMTKEQMIKDFENDAELRAGESQRLKPYSLDEHYIAATLEYPFDAQVKNLQRAMDSAGVKGEAQRQRAYEIHDRLRTTIDKELIKLARDARLKGVSKIIELIDGAKSETVQLTAAITATKDIFPDVETKQETIDDIDRELEQIEQDINQSMH